MAPATAAQISFAAESQAERPLPSPAVPGGPGIAPGVSVPGNGSGLMPQNSVPNLAPPPRLVPQPLSQPTPYQPLE